MPRARIGKRRGPSLGGHTPGSAYLLLFVAQRLEPLVAQGVAAAESIRRRCLQLYDRHQGELRCGMALVKASPFKRARLQLSSRRLKGRARGTAPRGDSVCGTRLLSVHHEPRCSRKAMPPVRDQPDMAHFRTFIELQPDGAWTSTSRCRRPDYGAVGFSAAWWRVAVHRAAARHRRLRARSRGRQCSAHA